MQTMQRISSFVKTSLSYTNPLCLDALVSSIVHLLCTGVVGQEPVLFDFTIEENIRLGRENCSAQDIEQVTFLAFYFENNS